MKEIKYAERPVWGPMASFVKECGTKAYETSTGCMVIVSSNEDGRWHLSISHFERYPTWEEIRHARYVFVPDDIHMVMPLPPKRFYLNLHPYAFHLWELQEIKLRSIIEAG